MLCTYHPKLIERMVTQTSKVVYGLIVVSLIYLWTFWEFIPSNLLLSWCLTQIMFIAFRFMNSKTLQRYLKDKNIEKVRRHICYLLVSIILSAFIWIMAAILGNIYAPPHYEFVSLIMITGLVTTGAFSLAYTFYIYVFYFFIMLLSQFGIMLYYGEAPHIAIALFLIFTMPIIIKLSKNIYTTYLDSISLNEALEKNAEEMHKLSITDSLTSIYNRRYFFDASQKLIELSKREKKSSSLLMMDIDFFKKINDTYGHKAGDIVLIEITKEIKNSTRSSDIFARVGGEEFAIFLYNTSLANANIIGQQICDCIEKKKFTYENKPIQITLSIGVSTLDEDINTLDLLYYEADTKLYIAKEKGRNQVC